MKLKENKIQTEALLATFSTYKAFEPARTRSTPE